MATATGAQPRFRLKRPGATTIAGMLLDPAVAVATLVATALAFRVQFDRGYVILALLVFSMTLSNDATAEDDTNRRSRTIGVRWAMTAAALWLLGWSTDTLKLFDDRVVLVW